MKSVFAIICSDERIWRIVDVVKVFHDKYGKTIDADNVQKALQRLLKEAWIVKKEEGFVPYSKCAEELRKGISIIESKTNSFFQGIIERVEEQLDSQLSPDQSDKIYANLRNTFNLYVRMYGFESFVTPGLYNTSHPEIVESEDIVNAALDGLDEKVGDLLLSVLSELIERPTKEQSETMMLWIKIFLGTEIMRLDPQLSELETSNLRGKKFILDTDILLYCLTDHPKRSKSYQKLLSKLRKIGCDLIIPEEVVIEVLNHALCAENYYNRFKTTLKSIDIEIIEEKANNIFVKDFCIQDRMAKPGQTFKQYMQNNFLSDDNQLQFMKDFIEDKLKVKPCLDDGLVIDEAYQPYKEDLTKKIFERTKQTDNEKWRSDDEVQRISETDAKLYLSTLSLNKDINDKGRQGMLRANVYLVTFTTKSIKSAQEMNIRRNFVTRPELLINLLSEIGEFNWDAKGFVNLFDNPFLAHIIDSNWDMIKNLSVLGLNMHHKNITMLKRDLGEVYHRYMTENADNETINTSSDFESVRLTPKHFFEMAEEVNRLGYELMPEPQSLVNEYRQKTEQLKEAEQTNQNYKRLLDKKASGYRIYNEKREMGKRRNTLGKYSKKGLKS
ncbi:MAG: hypothetical protein ACI4SI_05085, partial [Candidatus Ornithospirochaeta sp.]